MNALKTLVLFVVMTSFAQLALAEDEADPLAGYTLTGEQQKCLRTPFIRDTKVLDDSTILFRMRSGELYVNQLDKPCPQLKKNNSFTYRAPVGNQLCNNDAIVVFYSGALLGFNEGPTCSINGFDKVARVETDK